MEILTRGGSEINFRGVYWLVLYPPWVCLVLMSSEESRPLADTIQQSTNPKIDFNFDKSPAVQGSIQDPEYDVVCLKDGKRVDSSEPDCLRYPEIDFRASVNDIPRNTYATHPIHKHPAVFIPHIPRHIIQAFTTKQDEDGDRPLVIDSFNGSGTTGLEAKLLGRDYLGIEINPLSKLVSDVKVSLIPPTLARRAKYQLIGVLSQQTSDYYPNYDVDFPDDTEKSRWFEEDAIGGLTRIRKSVKSFISDDFDVFPLGLDQEEAVVVDLGLDASELKERLDLWFVLMIANTVFEVSNADPNVSKAHRSPKMRELIKNNEHPPSAVDVFEKNLSDSLEMLIEYWNLVYGTQIPGGPEQTRISKFIDGQSEPLNDNQSHKSRTDIRLDDAREFSYDEYLGEGDIAITSPPYINAMNYYRGTKLRLFWVSGLLVDTINSDDLRRSIVGTNSVKLGDKISELPKTLYGSWNGSTAEYRKTSLPALDSTIIDIYSGGLSEAKNRSYITWKFFANDMLKSLSRTYEHLKPGAHFFFLIGENTIGGNRIKSHRFIADIAQNLGKFEGCRGEFDDDEGFDLLGFGWDEISNRDLFQNRNHTSGVIEGEWVVVLQKPR